MLRSEVVFSGRPAAAAHNNRRRRIFGARKPATARRNVMKAGFFSGMVFALLKKPEAFFEEA